MISTLAYIKCQVIFYNTAKDEMWFTDSFGILSFYFPPLELVHRVSQYVCLARDLTMAKKKTEQLLREQKSMKMLTNLHKIYSE